MKCACYERIANGRARSPCAPPWGSNYRNFGNDLVVNKTGWNLMAARRDSAPYLGFFYG